MEYLAIIGISLAFLLPMYVAAIYSKYSKFELPKKFTFCIITLIFSYGALGIVVPIFVLTQMVVIFLLPNLLDAGFNSVAEFFIGLEAVNGFIIIIVPAILSFVVPIKLAPKWQRLVQSYS
jgi:hypothetical protein